MRVKRKVHKSYLSPVGERGGKIFSLRRQCLYCPIVRIFFRTSSRLAKIRLHFRTNCVRFLLLIYISDPDGECLDIDDLRSVWEEFVDALRDATGASEAYSDNEKYTSNSYQSLEKPVMKRNESFHKLAQDLNELVLQKSPGSSRGGSTHGIQRISSKGMLLGIGCSSREPSLRGGNEWAKMKSEMSPEALAKKLERTVGDK